MKITERLEAAIDRADAVYKSSDPTIGRSVDELKEVVTALIIAVKALDARE